MEILIPEYKIERRVRAMAHKISEEHKASGCIYPPVMICVLNGGFAFFSDLVKDILEQAAKINQEIILPLAKIGDEKPCVYENGIVRSPPGYKEVYKKFIEDGWISLSCDPKYGGQGMPRTVSAFFDEMLSAASLSFKLYSELSIGAYNCIRP